MTTIDWAFHSCQQSAHTLSWIVKPVWPPVGGLAIRSAVRPHRTHWISAIVSPPLLFRAILSPWQELVAPVRNRHATGRECSEGGTGVDRVRIGIIGAGMI